MAEEGNKGSGNVADASMAGLLKRIANNVVGDSYDEPKPIEAAPEVDSTEETTEETPEETTEGEGQVEETVEETPEEEKPRDKVQERIDKLTAQKKTAEEKLTELQAKVEELSKGPQKEYVPVPTVADPLADVLDFSALQERERIAETVRAQCIRNPDGYSTVVDGKEMFFSAADIREALVETDRLLRKDIPARQKWLEQSSSVTEQAKLDFPELFDARTKDYQLAQNIERSFPDIKKLPSYKQLIGMLILGEKELLARKSKKPVAGKAAETKKVPTPPASSTSTATKTSPKPASSLPKHPSRSDAVNHIMNTVLKNQKYN